MKILHVGWGFQPFRTGGLIEYVEDLMEIQVKKGYEVSYFCTGRFTITSKKPFLKKWKNKKGVTVFEEWNPPVISGFENGIENPAADVKEKTTEAIFLNLLAELKPEIVHIQEFLGFPTSLIESIKLQHIKIVFTVEDYYYLCPTIRLLLPDGKFCKIKGEELGRQCTICCQNAPKNNLNYKLQNLYPSVFNIKTITFLKQIKNTFFKKAAPADQELQEFQGTDEKIHDFNQRRSYNLSVLSKVDLVIAMSDRVAEIFSYYRPLDNMITLNLTLKHIDDLQPNQRTFDKYGKVRFCAINALSSPIKGRDLLMALFEIIDTSAWKNNIEIVVMGRVDPNDEATLKRYDFVKLTGKFKAKDLNSLLDDLKIDVGMVPSIWEEAYGFVGVEFLAKGIPVIGNNIGGIPDYVTEETGWLNETCDAEGLYRIITGLITDKESILAIRQNLITKRSRYVKSMETHFTEMDTIYRELLNK